MKKVLEDFYLESTPFKLRCQRMSFGWKVHLKDSGSGDIHLHSDTQEAFEKGFCRRGDLSPKPVIREMLTRCDGMRWVGAVEFLNEAMTCLEDGFHI